MGTAKELSARGFQSHRNEFKGRVDMLSEREVAANYFNEDVSLVVWMSAFFLMETPTSQSVDLLACQWERE